MTPISSIAISKDVETPPATPRSSIWRNRTLRVSSSTISTYLHKLLPQLNIPIHVVREELEWVRDSCVTLPNGALLIPYPLTTFSEEDTVEDEFIQLLPIDQLHFEDVDYAGLGISWEYYHKTIDYAKKAAQPFQLAATCIEGGNCRIFISSDGKPKAIVGYSSVIFSLIALRRNGYFNTHREMFEKMVDEATSPEQDSIRIAELELLNWNQLDPSVLDDWSSKCIKHAKEIEVEIQMTKNKIAEELRIPLDRIAFVLQDRFHIDLEIFAGPGDTIFLHDESQVLSLQKELDPKMAPFLEETVKHSEERLERAMWILKKNQIILQGIGCKPVAVPGVLDSTKKEEKTVNFMNGILFDGQKPHYITNGIVRNSLCQHIENDFLARVKQACPSLHVHFIDRWLPKLIAKSDGGLHCITSIAI